MKKILFICTANKLRSLTAEHIFNSDNRFEVKSAGTNAHAATALSVELLNWADYVLVMEKKHRNIIRAKFPQIYANKQIICLYIPDIYEYMEEGLIAILQQRINGLFGKLENQ